GKLVRIGVFYDGNYFAHVSNYYNYEHERNARLSISGLHDFIKHQVAEEENVESKYCQLIDSHYFRGRLNAYEVPDKGKLIADRIFDDILMNEGVTTHYFPIRSRDGRIEEKGVDIWLSLEAYETTLHKKFDVMVLIACDGDYVPLVRKLNAQGVRVMVLGWDFSYTDERTGRVRKTVTSVDLLREATYPVAMHQMIDNKVSNKEALINRLFIPKEKKMYNNNAAAGPIQKRSYDYNPDEVYQSTIHSLKNGYGFIYMPPNNLYFHWTGLEEGEFNELQEGEEVEFNIAQNERGQDIAINVKKHDPEGVEYEEEEYEDEFVE
ncbi:MAG: NYN domain-containing protein, partial [Bacteroidota bacterium]